MATALKPIVSWWEDYIDTGDGLTKQRPVPNNLWDLGEVDADNNPELTTHTFYIWNNKRPASPPPEYGVVPDMMNCRITTKDGTFATYVAGEMKSPLVKEQWIIVGNELSTTPSGSLVMTPVGSYLNNGVLTQKDIQITAFGTGVTTGVISGAMNDGTFTTEASKNNYAKVIAQMKIPASADAAENRFLVRIYYNV